MMKPFISIGDGKLRCTICLWYKTDRIATYIGLSPSRSWHGLCDSHNALHGHKYNRVAVVVNGKLPDWIQYIG